MIWSKHKEFVVMMTSSNGNSFRVTGPLCGEFTGPGEFPTQRPVTRSFDVFFDLRLNKRLSKQPWCWWFETPSWSLWRHCNGEQNTSEKYFVPCGHICPVFPPSPWRGLMCERTRSRIEYGGQQMRHVNTVLFLPFYQCFADTIHVARNCWSTQAWCGRNLPEKL